MQVESEVDASAATTATAPARAVLTAPLSLEGGLAAELQPANLVQRVLSLFGNVRPGADLSHFQVKHKHRYFPQKLLLTLMCELIPQNQPCM